MSTKHKLSGAALTAEAKNNKLVFEKAATTIVSKWRYRLASVLALLCLSYAIVTNTTTSSAPSLLAPWLILLEFTVMATLLLILGLMCQRKLDERTCEQLGLSAKNNPRMMTDEQWAALKFYPPTDRTLLSPSVQPVDGRNLVRAVTNHPETPPEQLLRATQGEQ